MQMQRERPLRAAPLVSLGRDLPHQLDELCRKLVVTPINCSTVRNSLGTFTQLPKAEHDAEEWQAAMEALLLVAENDGPTMFTRIGDASPCRRKHELKATSAPRRKRMKAYRIGRCAQT